MFGAPGSLVVVAYDSVAEVGRRYNLTSSGVFTIEDIPKYAGTKYIIRLNISDASGVFLSSIRDVAVDSNAPNGIFAGEIRLNTKDGAVFKAENLSCLKIRSNRKALSW